MPLFNNSFTKAGLFVIKADVMASSMISNGQDPQSGNNFLATSGRSHLTAKSNWSRSVAPFLSINIQICLWILNQIGVGSNLFYYFLLMKKKSYPYVLSQLRVCADQGYRFHGFQKHGSDKEIQEDV